MPTPTPESASADSLAPHIVQFLELARQSDAAEKSKDPDAIAQAEDALSLFFGKQEEKQRREIFEFIERQEVAQRLAGYQNATHGRVQKLIDNTFVVGRTTFNAIGDATKATVLTIPPALELLSDAAVSGVGSVVVGVRSGVRKFLKKWEQAA